MTFLFGSCGYMPIYSARQREPNFSKSCVSIIIPFERVGSSRVETWVFNLWIKVGYNVCCLKVTVCTATKRQGFKCYRNDYKFWNISWADKIQLSNRDKGTPVSCHIGCVTFSLTPLHLFILYIQLPGYEVVNYRHEFCLISQIAYIRYNLTFLTPGPYNMPNYRYSRLQNDLDDDDEEDAQHQLLSTLESSSPIKNSYSLRLVISVGIIAMFIIALSLSYHGKIEKVLCQMVRISYGLLRVIGLNKIHIGFETYSVSEGVITWFKTKISSGA